MGPRHHHPGPVVAAANVSAKVTEAEAAKLGKELTCVGAEAGPNKDGTIPAFSGKWLGTPPIKYTPHVGQHPADPFAADKPLFVITQANAAQYAARLSDGQKALLARFPNTYKIPVYQGRREFRYPDKICELAKKNAREAELIDNGFGFTGVMGAIPSRSPSTPWKCWPTTTSRTAPSPKRTAPRYRRRELQGRHHLGASVQQGHELVTAPENLGKPMEGNMAYNITGTLLPERDKGTMTTSIEPVNFAKGKRLAWNYDPGTRRVRQLPQYGYDTPLAGSGGKLTIDQDRLMNGAPDRYEWSLHGKREMYIPANAYKVHDKGIKYADLLKPGHPNPDMQRYELRRVWVLEGKLKDGYRHPSASA
jgi:hypothetical protein